MAQTDTDTEYFSTGWWKDGDGNIHQGSVESAGYLKAKEKGRSGTEPKREIAVESSASDAASAMLELSKGGVAETKGDAAAELAAAEKAAAEAKAAEEAAAAAAAGKSNRTK